MTMSEEKQVYATIQFAHGFTDALSLANAITWLSKFAGDRKILVCGEQIIAGKDGSVTIINPVGPAPDYDVLSMHGPDGEEIVIMKISSH
jgi:hypothetical protein